MLRHAAVLAAVTSALVLTANPAAAEFRLERRLALGAGGNFSLRSDTGSVTLTGDSASGVVITVTSADDNLADRLDIQFSDAGGNVTVTAKRRGTFSSFFDGFRGNVHFEVHVPRAAGVDVSTAGGSIRAAGLAGQTRVHTSGGSITVDDVEKDLDASTSGGSVHVQHVRGPADVHTSGGSIDVSDVRGDLRASTSGGSVRVHDAGGRVDAHSSGGSVQVSFARGNNRGGDLSTSGGGVSAEVDPRVALSIDAGTSGGSVSSDLPVTVRGTIGRSSLHGDLNGGGSALRMHTSGGGIRIGAAR
jgi:hypothetical protein